MVLDLFSGYNFDGKEAENSSPTLSTNVIKVVSRTSSHTNSMANQTTQSFSGSVDNKY